MSSPPEFLAGLTARRPGRVTESLTLPGRAARTAEWPSWVAPPVRGALIGAGLPRPWTHQREVIDLVHARRHVVISTGTASGKSLGYLVPALSYAVDGLEHPLIPTPTTLYLAPTKALAHDQLDHVRALAVPGVVEAAVDGDTAPEHRRWVRQHAHLVATNPDLLHHSLLPGHERWRRFLRGLRLVVVDECHVYRGLFGAQVSQVLWRLQRIARHHGADPTFVLASATVGDPAGHARALTGLDCVSVTDDGSPRGRLELAFWRPPEGEDGRRSAVTEAGDLLGALTDAGARTVAFARSRAGAEAVAERARSVSAAPIAAYRGGYLPEERRILERDLRSGALRGVAATNALELGVDISGLDAVVVAGWPGRLASLWQQVGRAGRSGEDALAVVVVGDDPLETYVAEHAREVLAGPVEPTVLDPTNPQVVGPQLVAAAAESPLRPTEVNTLSPTARRLLDVLTGRGILRRRSTGWFWTGDERPTDQVRLRGVGSAVDIVETRSGRVVGTVDEASADAQVHTGAVHVHQGEAWVVTELDLVERVARVVRGDPGWSTRAQSKRQVSLFAPVRTERAGPLTVHFGPARVTAQVTAFLRIGPQGQVLGRHALDLPERTLTTKAIWWTLEPDALGAAGLDERRRAGALHATEHAVLALLPLVATVDRWDVGGASAPAHPDTGLPTVVVNDGHPGGAGFAERGLAQLPRWLQATRDAIAGCPCATGCPSCIQSPGCGSGNEPLDKAGALTVLAICLAHLAPEGHPERYPPRETADTPPP